GGGQATLKTAQGEPLTVTTKGKKVLLTDAKGGMAVVTTANVMQSNGVIHVINGVLQP
ncbi:fasciclin domain-containing protein, partial [Methylobacterium brachythecii]